MLLIESWQVVLLDWDSSDTSCHILSLCMWFSFSQDDFEVFLITDDYTLGLTYQHTFAPPSFFCVIIFK